VLGEAKCEALFVVSTYLEKERKAKNRPMA